MKGGEEKEEERGCWGKRRLSNLESLRRWRKKRGLQGSDSRRKKRGRKAGERTQRETGIHRRFVPQGWNVASTLQSSEYIVSSVPTGS